MSKIEESQLGYSIDLQSWELPHVSWEIYQFDAIPGLGVWKEWDGWSVYKSPSPLVNGWAEAETEDHVLQATVF